MCVFFFLLPLLISLPYFVFTLSLCSLHSTMASPQAPSPGLSKKPHFQFPEQPSRIRQIPSKSHSNSICKTLTVLVILLAIPFFPSRAPDFISKTIFTQFWEIIHLLFIGIAVSYGLFGRKTEKIEISRNDDSSAYLSGISHLSSIFEDGFGNICCGPDEQAQDVMQSYYANCRCFGDQFLGKSRCVVHGDSSTKIRSFRGRENFGDSNGNNVNQTWSSKCLNSESIVVVSNGENLLGESFDFEPLNLPVRSLRSNVVDNDKPELPNRNDSCPKIEAEGKNGVKVKKIRGMVPTNLEKKFEEPDGLSLITWRSASERMENGEELSNIKPCPHCRRHLTGDFEFEHIKSRSNKVSKISSSPELENSEVENAEGEKVISISRPKIATLNDEVPFDGSRGRPFIVGDNFEEDKVGKGKQPIESSDSDTKPLALAKALSRAKSVRTKKPIRYVMNQKEHCSSRTNGKLEDLESNSFVKKGKREEPEKPPVDHKSEEIGRHFPMPKPKSSLPGFFKEEKEDIVEQNVTESEEECEEVKRSGFNESCDEDDGKANIDYDLGSEVDRKADEFIAKFRSKLGSRKPLR